MSKVCETFGVDLRTLALFDILLGIFLLLDLLARATDLIAHYTDNGVFPRSTIGKVIANLRTRENMPDWLIGTSHGTISDRTAAYRLTVVSAPDGLILTPPVTSGREGGYKA